jgi:murein DD-endopeptidase MepM/ murein hydrolase activator NlpD
MTDCVAVFVRRNAVRFALTGLAGIWLSGCSADSTRFSQSMGGPFNNPFASASDSGGAPAPRVTSAPLANPKYVTAAHPNPVTVSALPTPAPASTGEIRQPVTGFGNGWTAVGGSPIIVADGDSLDGLSRRYGVPASALMSANGLNSPGQVHGGMRLVVPVYNANGKAAATPRRAEPEVAEEAKPKAERKREREEAAEETGKARSKAEKRREREEADAAGDDARAKSKAKREREEADADGDDAKAKSKAKREREEADADTPKSKSKAKREREREEADAADDESKAKAKKKVEREQAGDAATTKAKKKEAREQADADDDAAKLKAKKKAGEAVARNEPVREPAKAEKPKPAAPAVVAKDDPPAKSARGKPNVDTAPTGNVRGAGTPAATPLTSEQADASGANPEFRWPARGRIIQGFKSGGNDGINISVPEGTSVRAAENGVVAYAGSELKGYGNLVLIRHPNGFVSAYANNGELDVKRGDSVKRGQVIAKSGQSGNVNAPQLHFELRKGSTPVDPTNYLAGL